MWKKYGPKPQKVIKYAIQRDVGTRRNLTKSNLTVGRYSEECLEFFSEFSAHELGKNTIRTLKNKTHYSKSFFDSSNRVFSTLNLTAGAGYGRKILEKIPNVSLYSIHWYKFQILK